MAACNLPLFAVADPEKLALVGSAAMGLAVVGLVEGALDVLSVPRPDVAELGVFEFQRRALLREGSLAYRWFEPLIDSLAKRQVSADAASMAQLKRNVVLSGTKLPWKPEEYIAAKQVESALVGLTTFVVVLGFTLDFVTALLFGLGVGFAYLPLCRRQVKNQAEQHLLAIRRRLPFVMDLTALTMDAGATFIESVTIAVKENPTHPLGLQLAEVLRDISVGRTRREALEDLQDRLGDENVTEITAAIIKGEELGTPLSQILQNQAEQMRLKRSQWAEKAAAEAQVNIVFPGMIVMIACLVIVMAPFVLGPMFAKR